MKMNLKARIKNPIFLAQLFLAVAAPIGVYFGVKGPDLTTWAALFALILAAVSNPYVLFTIVVSVWAALNNPLTAGLSDTKAERELERPKKEGL